MSGDALNDLALLIKSVVRQYGMRQPDKWPGGASLHLEGENFDMPNKLPVIKLQPR